MAFIYVAKDRLELLESIGLRPLKIGDDAIVEIPHFIKDVAHNKHFRAVRNKFERLGYHFEIAEPNQTRDVLIKAAAVTKSWLQFNGRLERGFGLGYHDTEYLRRNRLYLLFDGENNLVAFANTVKSYNPRQQTIDLMRQMSNSETGAMDMLFLCILEHLFALGVAEFSLGLAPLTGFGAGAERSLEERAIGYFGRLGLGRFSFQGLRRFKGKFEPRWDEKYFLCERGPLSLGRTAAAISEVMSGR